MEGYVFQQFFQHGVQAAGADVFGFLVHLESDFGQAGDAVGGEIELYAVGGQQGLVLLGEAGIGAGEDGLEVFHGEAVQFHADGEAALQLGNQVAGFA